MKRIAIPKIMIYKLLQHLMIFNQINLTKFIHFIDLIFLKTISLKIHFRRIQFRSATTC